jgi:branched-chain amino acid aminotransferase
MLKYPFSTTSGLGVRHSDTATLFVILSPTGPYFKNGFRPISLLAVSDTVRAWPGGTGEHKLGSNYAPSFMPQINAASKGYDQILWLLEADCQNGDKGKKEFRITEVGAMNVFVVVKRDDGSGCDFLCQRHLFAYIHTYFFLS